MNDLNIYNFSKKPRLYDKGNSIMWTDKYISKQLLKMHLDKNSDIASRRPDKIDGIVKWILENENRKQLKILDLGCGPGLYTEKFAKEKNEVTGIDFSVNSINFARNRANKNKLKINYICDNYLNMDYTNEFDLIILIYLDFCVLLPSERNLLIKKIFKALKKGGRFIFDVVNEKNIKNKILEKSYEVMKSGFWSDKPYIVLNNGYHYCKHNVLANQHIVLDNNGNIRTYIFWNHYYTDKEIKSILKSKGFKKIINYENLLKREDFWSGENITFYVANKL